jgi:hypothetical protein
MNEFYLLYYFVKNTPISIENQPEGPLVKLQKKFLIKINKNQFFKFQTKYISIS